MSKDSEDIKVNRRDKDEVVFESQIVQSIYDGIGYLKDETTEILKEIDSTEFKQNIYEMDVQKFGEAALNHFSDFAEELSKFKDEVINKDEVPDFIKDSAREAKIALNRDEDYIRTAKRKLDNMESDELADAQEENLRVVQLCDKSIDLNNKNPEAYYVKGLALTNLEMYDEAIEEFICSLALEDNVESKLAIANVNRLNKDFNDAINVYDSVLDEVPFEALKGKAYVYYDWQKYGQASKAFSEANDIEALDDESKKIWDECSA